MNLAFISRAVGATKLALKAHGPTIMVVTGVASMGAAVVTGGRQTLKMEAVLTKHAPDLDKVQQALDLDVPSYTHEVARSDRFKIYTRAGWDLAKLYAVPGVLFVGGACLVFGGHRLMLQRNATLAIAFTSLQKAFETYRARNREYMGDEYDQALVSGSYTKEIVDPVTGEKEMANYRDWDGDLASPYAKIFEQGATSMWTPDIGINKMTVQNQRLYAQELLNRRDYLYLWEVLQALGFDPTPISRVVGWKNRRLPDGSKEIAVVDFGLDRKLQDDWIYTHDAAIFLDFNCQGLIVGGEVQKILEQS